MNRNIKVRCRVCGKCMRSDSLKRHIKIHDAILNMPADKAREEIKILRAANMEREEKRQKIEEIAIEGDKDLREKLLRDNRIYLDKIEFLIL